MDASTGALRTSRLLLRRWRDEDRPHFAAMNADPAVMRFYPAPMTRQESDAMADRIAAGFDAHGFGLWAVEIPGVALFAGYVGLARPAWEAHFTPCVEMGWRLAAAHWGKGYAPEAAARCRDEGFVVLGLKELVAFTVPRNAPSRRVMEKIGMVHDAAGNFDHPRLAAGHPLQRHVLYRIDRAVWLERRKESGCT